MVIFHKTIFFGEETALKNSLNFEYEVEKILLERRQDWIQIGWCVAASLDQIDNITFYKKYHTDLYKFIVKFNNLNQTDNNFFNDLNFPLNYTTLDALKRNTSEEDKIGQQLIAAYTSLLDIQSAKRKELFPVLKLHFNQKLEKAKTAALKAKEKLKLKTDSLEIEIMNHSNKETLPLQPQKKYRNSKLSALKAISDELDTIIVDIDQTQQKINCCDSSNHPPINELQFFLLEKEKKFNNKIFEVKKDNNVSSHEGFGFYVDRIIQALTMGFAKLRTQTEEKIDECFKTIHHGLR